MADTRSLGPSNGVLLSEDQGRPDGARALAVTGGIKGLYVIPAGDASVVGVSDIRGGGYLIRATATSWGTGSAKLQQLDNDGVTYYDVDAANLSWTANATKDLAKVAQGSTFRFLVTGNVTGFAAQMGGY